jgi:hypothetical protein
LGETFLEKMGIGELFWGKKNGKLNHLRNLSPKIIYECKRLLRIRFGVERKNIYLEKCDGIGKPREHIDRCMA